MTTPSIGSFLEHLRTRGIHLRLEGENLRLSAPPEALTNELRDAIRERKPEILNLLKQLASGQVLERPPIPVADRRAPMPLSFAQQRLYFVQQLAPDDPSYNLPSAFRFRGNLDQHALERAFHLLEDRHEILRTIFVEGEDGPVQIVQEPFHPALELLDLAGAEQAEFEAQSLAEARFGTPFDLARGPLYRFWLLAMAADEHILLLSMHHIIADAWSMNAMMSEVVTLYRKLTTGQAYAEPLPRRQYGDFACWQRQTLAGEAYAKQCDYWRGQLAGAPPALTLPTDFQRPPTLVHEGDVYHFTVPRHLTIALKSFAQANQATLSMAVQALFALLMARYSGQDDICVGQAIANRNHPDLEDLLGFFVNTLVLRTSLAGNPDFATLLARVRKTALEAYAHQDVPFERVVEIIAPRRSSSQTPLFQVMCDFQNARVTLPEMGDLALTPVDWGTQTAKFDLTLDLEENGETLTGLFEYRTALFRPETIARMATHFVNLIEQALADPGRSVWALPMLTADELAHQRLGGQAVQPATAVTFDIPGRFMDLARRQGDAIAVSHRDQSLTYAEAAERTHRIAHALAGRGFGTEDLIALWLERDLNTPALIMGIHAAGCAWLPLSRKQPSQRQAIILGDAKPVAIVTTQDLEAELLAQLDEMALCHRPPVLRLEDLLAEPCAHAWPHALDRFVDPRQRAYLLYTSGSTGVPKGAMLCWANLCNHLDHKIARVVPEAGVTVCQDASLTFDISIWQLLAPLLVGATVRVIEDAVAKDPGRLIAALDAWPCQVFEVVPSFLSFLLEEEQGRRALSRVQTLFASGEAFPAELCRQWFRLFPQTRVINGYGATEAGDDTSCHLFLAAPPAEMQLLPLGPPIRNMQTFVLDRRGNFLPQGATGQIALAGVGLGRGYLNAPAKTASVFVPNPFATLPGDRLYLTGDLGRMTDCDEPVYLGRVDSQIKLRGFRIELGEIETALNLQPHVELGAAKVWKLAGGDTLTGYVQLKPGTKNSEAEIADLRQGLSKILPEYMVPETWVFVDRFALNANGKLDRGRLPAPEARQEVVVPPRNEAETVLCRLFAEVLERDQVGVTANFFELGGHSLLAARLLSRIRRQFGHELTLAMFFENPTVAAVATCLEVLDWSRDQETEMEPEGQEMGFL